MRDKITLREVLRGSKSHSVIRRYVSTYPTSSQPGVHDDTVTYAVYVNIYKVSSDNHRVEYMVCARYVKSYFEDSETLKVTWGELGIMTDADLAAMFLSYLAAAEAELATMCPPDDTRTDDEVLADWRKQKDEEAAV